MLQAVKPMLKPRHTYLSALQETPHDWMNQPAFKRAVNDLLREHGTPVHKDHDYYYRYCDDVHMDSRACRHVTTRTVIGMPSSPERLLLGFVGFYKMREKSNRF